MDEPLHDPETGLSVRKAVYGRTEQEARAMLIEALAARQAGSLLVSRGRELTVGHVSPRGRTSSADRPWLGPRNCVNAGPKSELDRPCRYSTGSTSAIDAMKERASAPSSTSATYRRLKSNHQKRRPKHMIYVGIDLHRKWSQLAALDAAGEPQLSRRIPSRPEDFFRVFGELGPEPMEVAFEATFGCSWLIDLLADAGIPAHMAHPLATKAIAAGRVKNDTVDARTLAYLLRANLLPEAWIEPVEAREARRLVRMRASLVRLNSRLKCQVHALLADYGVNPDLTDVFGRQGRRIMAELRLPEVSQHRLEVNLRLIDGLAQEVKAADQMLKQRFGRDARALRLLPIPGVGLFTSATVVAEVWDVSRFPSPRRLGSWAGLTPREHSSGEHTRRGHISKQGSRWLRWVLVEAATHALPDPQLREVYLRVRRGSKDRDQIARVAVAHRLLTLCYYALRDEAGCRAYPVSA